MISESINTKHILKRTLTNRVDQDQAQVPELQCLFKFKVDLKLRTESLVYENVHLEITEIITISCIL